MVEINPEHSAVILRAPVRTGFGDKRGPLAYVDPPHLLAACLREAVNRAGLPLEQIGRVDTGCATQAGKQWGNVSRFGSLLAWGDAGKRIPAHTTNKLCGSSLQSLVNSSDSVKAGTHEYIVVGGLDANSDRFLPPGADGLPPSHDKANRKYVARVIRKHARRAIWKTLKRAPLRLLQGKVDIDVLQLQRDLLALSMPKGVNFVPMVESGDHTGKTHGIDKQRSLEFGLQSNARFIHAQRTGRLDSQIVRIDTGRGYVDRDECPRSDTTMSALMRLRPTAGGRGIHGPGDSSQISIGAGALIVANEASAIRDGLPIMARVKATAETAGDPELRQLESPLDCIPKVLEKAGLTYDDIDLWEINEAFSAEVLFLLDQLPIPPENVNVNGGAIVLGHPFGATGIRLSTTLLHEMDLRAKEIDLGIREGKKPRYGLAVLCIGFGQAVAVIFERWDPKLYDHGKMVA